MTPKQLLLMRFIADYWMRYGYAPTYAEMRDHIGLASQSGVHRLISGLVERGYLSKTYAVRRGLRILRWPRGVAGSHDVFRFDPRDGGLIKIGTGYHQIVTPAPRRGGAGVGQGSPSKADTSGMPPPRKANGV